jgi:hypothetical protein
MVEQLNNIVLLTVDKTYIKKKKDVDDLMGLLSETPDDMQLFSGLESRKIIHIVSNSFNDVTMPTHIYVVIPEGNSPKIGEIVRKLHKIQADDKLCGAMQIWLQMDALRSIGVFAKDTREFAVALIAYNQLQPITFQIDKKPEGLDELLDAVLNPYWY